VSIQQYTVRYSHLDFRRMARARQNSFDRVLRIVTIDDRIFIIRIDLYHSLYYVIIIKFLRK